MTRLLLSLLAAGFLVGCGGAEPRFDAAYDVKSAERVQVRYARIEVALVTLPVYAQSEEIHIRDKTGAIVPLGPLWTDTPDRAVTLELAQRLDAITGRLVAPEPWPFRDFPDVKIDVRLDTFLATEDGAFALAGQVFVAPEEGGPDRSLPFDFRAGPTGVEGPAGIALARNAAVTELADFIARKGLR